ncbi:MAG: GNAT family N-acetyltransferase [Acidimicrobiia bacterium]
MVEVRRAVAADLPEIHRIWWATGSSPRKQNPWFAHVLSTGVMVVATEDDEVLGFAGHRMVWRTNVVSDCFVDPARQGLGIGTKMLPLSSARRRTGDDPGPRRPQGALALLELGMMPVVDCPYLQAKAIGSGDLVEIRSFPIAPSDLPHLQDNLGCRFVTAGESLHPEIDRVILDRRRR